MTEHIEYLTVDDLLELAGLLLGEPVPIGDLGLLGAAAAWPQTTALGTDANGDVWTRAAALLQSVVKNHGLIDGNERLGWLATAVFLEINGQPVTHVADETVFRFVVGVAGGQQTVDELARELRDIVGKPG